MLRDEMYACDGAFTYTPYDSMMTLNSVVFALVPSHSVPAR